MTLEGLVCRSCFKSYGKQLAVEDVSFQVKPGTTVGLVGANGAGKTTVLHAIVGLTRLDAGDITLDGIPTRQAQAKRRFAFMPDDLPRPDHLTGRELISLNTRLYGQRQDEAVVNQLADRLEMSGRLDQMVGSFSHGMARKVDFIAAIVVRPDVLILDEPFSGMDPWMVDEISGILGQRQEEGASNLLSSHDLELVARLANEIVMIDHGRVIFTGSVEELLDFGSAADVRTAFRNISTRKK